MLPVPPPSAYANLLSAFSSLTGSAPTPLPPPSDESLSQPLQPTSSTLDAGSEPLPSPSSATVEAQTQDSPRHYSPILPLPNYYRSVRERLIVLQHTLSPPIPTRVPLQQTTAVVEIFDDQMQAVDRCFDHLKWSDTTSTFTSASAQPITAPTEVHNHQSQVENPCFDDLRWFDVTTEFTPNEAAETEKCVEQTHTPNPQIPSKKRKRIDPVTPQTTIVVDLTSEEPRSATSSKTVIDIINQAEEKPQSATLSTTEDFNPNWELYELPSTGAIFADDQNANPSPLEACLGLFFGSFQEKEKKPSAFDPIFKERFGIETSVRYLSCVEIDQACQEKVKACWKTIVRKYGKRLKTQTNAKAYIDCIENSSPDGNDKWTRKYEIKKVSDEIGYGLFATKQYKKNEVIGFYAGRFVPLESLNDKRYAFEGFEDPCLEGLALDAREAGNALRYINHADHGSRKENVDTVEFFYNGLLYIMYQAKCAIKIGKELAIDYQDGYWEENKNIHKK